MSINQVTAAVSRITNVTSAAAPTDARVVIRENLSVEKVHQADAGHQAGDAVSDADLKKSVEAINRFFNENNSVNLNVDQESGRVVVRIVDRETNELIRQIPNQEVLELAKSLDQKNGMLLNEHA
ncbi:flagellar protein FlaG [Undibacterium flavidum]|uniref:Flagellar protein FlaG n=1 Tax=Undibacterium flavidum TaxID=2762297 RepID=A0ABR6YH98_9BURK|nr:flagellar protein FlaG [Undibacterium flavidum]MBC3875954.1 flagellar protein FlaG [Undibacterium flavidum]